METSLGSDQREYDSEGDKSFRYTIV